jgi:hypothetical protein
MGDRKQYDVSRPSTGLKPKQFKPTKKTEKDMGSQIAGEDTPKDSE